MTEKRDYLGAYESGLNIGATSTEQSRAGVTYLDSPLSAQMKVGDLRAQPVVFSASKPLWLWAFQVLLGVMTLLSIAPAFLYVGSQWVDVGPTSMKVRTEEKLSSLGSKAVVDEYRQLEIDRLKPLFKVDAPLAGIFGGCRSSNCYRVGLNALDKYRRYAVDPASYDHQICMLSATNDSRVFTQFAARWRIVRSSGMCELENDLDLQVRIARYDRDQRNIALIIGAAGLFLVMVAGWVLLGKINKPFS